MIFNLDFNEKWEKVEPHASQIQCKEDEITSKTDVLDKSTRKMWIHQWNAIRLVNTKIKFLVDESKQISK